MRVRAQGKSQGKGSDKRNRGNGGGNGERHARVPVGLLLDVQDEIHDLDVILGGVAELRRFCLTMNAIVSDDGDASEGRWIPASAGMTGAAGMTDRIGRAAREFNGKPLPLSGKHHAGGHAMDAADLIDLGNAPDTIVTAVRCRLERVKELLAMVVRG